MKIYRVTYKQNNESKTEHTMAETFHQVVSRYTRPVAEGREVLEITLVCETEPHGDSIFLRECLL